MGQRLELFHQQWTVTETGRARLLGIRGELPEQVSLQRRFGYVHLSAPGPWLVTLEFGPPGTEVEVFRGQWVDPFEIEVLG